MTPPAAQAQSAEQPLCRNCGAVAAEAFCPKCGQETRLALPTLREFMREAMGRLVSFDARLWRTLRALVLRPGHLTRAYLDGQRRQYVRPARLLLAMSLILFAVIRITVGPEAFSEAFVVESARSARDNPHPAVKKAAEEPVQADTTFSIGLDDSYHVVVRGSAAALLTQELRSRWDRFDRMDRTQKTAQLQEGALRYGSYVLFALLPVFAVLQFVVHAVGNRRPSGRPRVYAEHLVYAAHLHTFLFLIAIVALVVPWAWAHWALLAWTIYYLMRAKREVYGGSWLGQLARTTVVGALYLVAIGVAVLALLSLAVLVR